MCFKAAAAGLVAEAKLAGTEQRGCSIEAGLQAEIRILRGQLADTIGSQNVKRMEVPKKEINDVLNLEREFVMV